MLNSILPLIVYKAKTFLQSNPFAPILFPYRTNSGESWQILVSRVPKDEAKAA